MIGFSLHQLEQLSAAGGWARFRRHRGDRRVRAVAPGVPGRDPAAPSVIARTGGDEPASLFVPMLLYTAGSLVAAILVWDTEATSRRTCAARPAP